MEESNFVLESVVVVVIVLSGGFQVSLGGIQAGLIVLKSGFAFGNILVGLLFLGFKGGELSGQGGDLGVQIIVLILDVHLEIGQFLIGGGLIGLVLGDFGLETGLKLVQKVEDLGLDALEILDGLGVEVGDGDLVLAVVDVTGTDFLGGSLLDVGDVLEELGEAGEVLLVGELEEVHESLGDDLKVLLLEEAGVETVDGFSEDGDDGQGLLVSLEAGDVGSVLGASGVQKGVHAVVVGDDLGGVLGDLFLGVGDVFGELGVFSAQGVAFVRLVIDQTGVQVDGALFLGVDAGPVGLEGVELGLRAVQESLEEIEDIINHVLSLGGQE